MTPAPPLELLPAVDVAAGRSVRLVRAEEGSAADHGDPLDVALEWQRTGAAWVHLVDIDAAFGRRSNLALLAEIVSALVIDVQLSGGVRDEPSLTAALSTGCARVNLSTAALTDPEWVAAAVGRHGARIAVGLDIRGERLVARGAGVDVGAWPDVLATLDAAGAQRYVITDVTRDGTLSGPNLDLLRAVCTVTDRPVVASGGISSVADVLALRSLVQFGVEGAILGQALYTGAVSLGDALIAAR